MYASLLRINPRFAWSPHPSGGSPEPGALHLGIFEQPARLLGVTFSQVAEKRPVADPWGGLKKSLVAAGGLHKEIDHYSLFVISFGGFC
jgi:hypothetical protein